MTLADEKSSRHFRFLKTRLSHDRQNSTLHLVNNLPTVVRPWCSWSKAISPRVERSFALPRPVRLTLERQLWAHVI